MEILSLIFFNIIFLLDYENNLKNESTIYYNITELYIQMYIYKYMCI